tara:strand:+ start:1175 stop:1915 length:741 start_codon:yes stop_codon:yes gene_type:complete
MQQRRMKRLAGPAFYVNVKYDQTMAKQNKERKHINRHPEYNTTHSWELFDVKEGEILVCKKRNRKKRDYAPSVISSVNGTEKEAKDNDKKLYDIFTFLGVAQTEHVAKSESTTHQGLVAGVGGIATIINDHSENICPGQILYLQDPPPNALHMRGIPKDKKRFCFAPLEPSDSVIGIQNELKNELKTLIRKAYAKNNVKADFVKVFVKLLKARQYPIAKALSHAKPGQRLDILLHPRVSQEQLHGE